MLAVLAAPAHAIRIFGGTDTDYPDKGKAIDQLAPASDYSDLVAQRSRAISIMRARDDGFVPSSELRDYLLRVVMKLATGLKLPASFQPDVRVLASPDFQAVCTPDGTIVVTSGLLNAMSSEDEIAFVLGHELSHAIYRHHDAHWFDRSQYYAVVSGMAVDKITTEQPSLTQNTGFNKTKFERGLTLAKDLYKLSGNVLVPQFEKGQEDAADALGLDLMVKAGYSADAANAVLEKIAVQEQAAANAAKSAQQSGDNKDSSGLIGILNGNFPDLPDLDPRNLLNPDILLDLFEKSIDRLSEQATTHHPAKLREKLLSDYEYREYRHLLPKQPVPLPWSGAGRAKGPGILLQHYAKADEADTDLDDTAGLAKAGPALEIATRPPTTDHAYTQYVAATYNQKRQNAAASEASLLKAIKGPEPSWRIYVRILNLYIGRSDWPKAQQRMDEAATRFDGSPVLLPKRIEILYRSGHQQDAEALVPQCETYDIHELSKACRIAAGMK